MEKLKKFYSENKNLFVGDIEEIVEKGFKDAEKRLVWIEKNIPEIIEIVDLGEPDGAIINTISLTVIICCWLMKLFY